MTDWPGLAKEVAMALNLPAVAIATTSLTLLIPAVRKMPLLACLIIAVFVYILWFLIGRWLECQLGGLPQLPQQVPGRVTWWLNCIAVLGCLLLAGLFVYFWLFPGWRAPHGIEIFSITSWLAFGALVFGARLIRWHALTKAAKYARGFRLSRHH